VIAAGVGGVPKSGLRFAPASWRCPSRVAARLPHLSKHDVAEIDAEIRAALSEIGGTD
jgi:hypothetical protein